MTIYYVCFAALWATLGYGLGLAIVEIAKSHPSRRPEEN